MTTLATVQANGLELSLFPWESPELVIAEVEAYLTETDAKPWLLDEDLDLMTPDFDGIVNDPLYDRYLAEVEATRFWSGEPVCNWSFLDGATLDEDADWTEEELSFCGPHGTVAAELAYYEATLPF